METQHSLMTEVVSACQNMFEFSKAFTAAAWIRHFGAEMHAKDLTTIKDAPNVGDVWIPFFVEMDASSISNL